MTDYNFKMEGSSCSEKDSAEARPKSILKHAHGETKPEVKWDEMNILETYHPANKDYGHMKINEPPTPYSHLEDSDGELDTSESSVDPETLRDSLSKASTRKHVHSDSPEEEEDDLLSEEGRAEKRVFTDKRKKHYDEFSKVRLARQLIAKELEEIDNSDDQQMDTSSDNAEPESHS
ncbi:protein phosphatase inhibitor 2-like isoform X2 [Rhopilema esculentum]|uniref:protein phosphatase inhibitor 2-like isoform X2 n=1 Tax=Rhopilema esculentum TaxID=499914 RepID=UPI0031D7B65F